MSEEDNGDAGEPALVTRGGNQHAPITSSDSITSESPLWRLFLDSSCSSASVFLR